MELMVRSLVVCHSDRSWLSLPIFDNGSIDDLSCLRNYAERTSVPMVSTGYGLNTLHNSHGDVLSAFVASRSEANHLLFLDADVCFFEPDTIGTMVRALDAAPDTFGLGPWPSWDGQTEIPQAARAETPTSATPGCIPAAA